MKLCSRLAPLFFGLVLSVGLTSVAASAAVHAGDQLVVTVFDHPELTGPVSVDSGGRISLPMAGNVDVRGLSPEKIANRIQRRLAFYILKPSVSVQLKAEEASIFISGGPGGVLKYEPGETLLTALGDLAPRAPEVASKDGALVAGDLSTLQRSRIDLRRVGIVRDGASVGNFDIVALEASGKAAPRIAPGDTIVLVDKPISVRVTGDVQRPGLAFLANDEPLSAALAQSGGILPTAETSNIELHRGERRLTLATGDSMFNAPAAAGDEILVHFAPHVSITGFVEKPGSVLLTTNGSLLGALYETGGPTKWADIRHVKVVSQHATTTYDLTGLLRGDLAQNPQLGDGDLVFVPEGHKISFSSVFQNILSATFLLK
jgi:protein involved in polysaccharide export with SLBB domain